MTLDGNALFQLVIGAVVLSVGGLMWRTYERLGQQNEKLSRIDVTLHGERGAGGLAARVDVLGKRTHRIDGIATAVTLMGERQDLDSGRIDRLIAAAGAQELAKEIAAALRETRP